MELPGELQDFIFLCERVAIRRGVRDSYLATEGREWLWKANLLYKLPGLGKVLVYHDRRMAVVMDYGSSYLTVFRHKPQKADRVVVHVGSEGMVKKWDGEESRFLTEWVEHQAELTTVRE